MGTVVVVVAVAFDAPPMMVRSTSLLAWVTVLLLIGALVVWIFGRSSWTPDEPREWGIAQAALAGHGLLIPSLSGEPFLEKPPLTYWASAASMALFGDSVAGGRAPNVLWAALSILAVMACAAALTATSQRRDALWIAALMLPTMQLAFRRMSWLATDAPMLAGVSVALASLWWFTHESDRARRRWAGLTFGAGCSIAFLAKGIFGLVVPGLAAACYLTVSRRLNRDGMSDARPGSALGLLTIGGWILAVALEPKGLASLREFLWDNSAGRFLPIDTAEHHVLHHAHKPGAILLRLPLMIFPWTFAVLPALWRAARVASQRGPDGVQRDRARFVLSTVLPGFAIVGLSATARDIYLLPCLPGCVWATILVMAERGCQSTGRRVWWLTTTSAILWLSALLLSAAALGYAAIQFGRPEPLYFAAFALVGAWATVVWRRSPRAANSLPTIARNQAPPLLAALIVGGILVIPPVNSEQDVYAFMRRVAPRLPVSNMVLQRGDETIRAAVSVVAGRNPLLARDLPDAARLLRGDPSRRLLFELGDDPLTPRARVLIANLRSRIGFAPQPRDACQHRHEHLVSGLGLQLVEELPGPAGRLYGVFSADPDTASSPRQQATSDERPGVAGLIALR